MQRRRIEFVHRGRKHIFSFTPEDEDWWTAFQSNGVTFDVHYDENYDHIVVYEVLNGYGDYSKTIYKKSISKQ